MQVRILLLSAQFFLQNKKNEGKFAINFSCKSPARCIFMLMLLWSICNCKGESITQGMGVTKEDKSQNEVVLYICMLILYEIISCH